MEKGSGRTASLWEKGHVGLLCCGTVEGSCRTVSLWGKGHAGLLCYGRGAR